MQYFPVFMDLRGQPVVLIGAGSVAERKARLLLKTEAVVRVIARNLNPQFQEWLQSGVIQHVATEYDANLLQAARLVFAASNDAALNKQAFTDAEVKNIPVNVIDDTAYCRFISPAVIDRSPVQIAISTGGTSPILARRIRAWLEALLPSGIGGIARVAGELRQLARDTLPLNLRRGFWERLMSDSQLRSWSLQTTGKIRQQMRQALINHPGAGLQDAGKRQRSEAQGRVYLVGAGPGRADLLTLRGLHILGQADVILHDHLVSEEVLDLARRDADRIYVGKRAGKHHRSQQDIHQLMLEQVNRGRIVVRLKGGDPFVFGRGGEELEFLSQHGIAYEVVPGITAAIACAAYSGIPLTHRDHAQTLTFVTGHISAANSGRNTAVAGPDWAAIAGPGRTAVVYMGVRQAPVIRKELLRAGVAGSTPVALIVNGSRDDQRILHGSVNEMSSLAAQAGKRAPGLLIIGQVASLGSNLGWFNGKSTFKSAA